MSPRSSLLTPHSKIYVAGHRGMVGAAIVRRLQDEGCAAIVTRTHRELDLADQQAVREFFRRERVDYVVLAAAKVGGILANNTYPAEFIYQNLMIEANVIHEAFKAGVQNLLFLGSSCIYPKFAPQPMREEHLLTGVLESTNEPYAVAKIAGIKMCESYNRQYGTDFRSAMPTNLYGPGDNYHLQNSHVIPAMLRKFHLARLAMAGNIEEIRKDEAVYGPIPSEIKEAIGLSPGSALLTPHPHPKVVLWGTGSPRREFLHVDDLAAACVFLMELPAAVYQEHTKPMLSHVNIGFGSDVTIAEVAMLIKEIVGFTGEVLFDTTKPDGTPRKLMDSATIGKMGWRPAIGLREGLQHAYDCYLGRLASEPVSA